MLVWFHSIFGDQCNKICMLIDVINMIFSVCEGYQSSSHKQRNQLYKVAKECVKVLRQHIEISRFGVNLSNFEFEQHQFKS